VVVAGGEHCLLGGFRGHWHPLVPVGRPLTRLQPHRRLRRHLPINGNDTEYEQLYLQAEFPPSNVKPRGHAAYAKHQIRYPTVPQPAHVRQPSRVSYRLWFSCQGQRDTVDQISESCLNPRFARQPSALRCEQSRWRRASLPITTSSMETRAVPWTRWLPGLNVSQKGQLPSA
jgi:hypothetical protein